MVKLAKIIKEHKEQYPSIFNIKEYYCNDHFSFIVMDFPYDILRGFIALLAVMSLLAGAFLTCLWFLFLYCAFTYVKKSSYIYKLIYFFQHENEVANENNIYEYMNNVFGKGGLNNEKVDDILYLLNSKDKIRKEGNMYFSNFSGPFKNVLKKSERIKI